MNENNHKIVCEHILDKYIKRISGSSTQETYIGDAPSNHVMLGMIKAGHDIEDPNFNSNNDMKFKSIPSVGLGFSIEKKFEGKMKLKLHGNLYYRSQPTFEDQIEYLIKKHQIFNSEIVDLVTLTNYIQNDPSLMNSREKIVDKFSKVSLYDLIGDIDLGKDGKLEDEKAINLYISSALDKFSLDSSDKSFAIKQTTININELLDKEKFEKLIKSSSALIKVYWIIKVYIKVLEKKDHLTIRLTLVNSTPPLNAYKDRAFDTTLYDARIYVQADSSIQFIDTKLNVFKHDYLEPTTVKGFAENSSFTYENKLNEIRTTNIPLFIQHRVKTIDTYNQYITFDKMIDAPIENLNILKGKMAEYLNQLETNFKIDLTSNKYSAKYLNRERTEIDSFKSELIKFENGIRLIETKNDIMSAFISMNKTFKLKINPQKKTYSGWRLFQIVFIVSQINDIVYSEYQGQATYESHDIDIVDLIYFPTGGGKTEAFLGCVVFNLFFDRIRGKYQGITAMIKYPLRLLSVQQLDRVLDVIVRANTILEDSYLDKPPFTLGYFVGGQNTKNDIKPKDGAQIGSMSQIEKNDEYRVIDVCPYCGENHIDVWFDKDNWKIIHRCLSCEKELPIYTIDDEIYRYLPSIIVGTVDKLANIGTSPKFKLLFGQHEGQCESHGFSNRSICPYCRKELSKTDLKDPIYTLAIQDELHLVRESLGTFASHYESFLNYYSQHLVDKNHYKKIKYICATATISNFEAHVLQLYNKNARSFPVSVKEKNFYSYIDENEISRFILGFAPYGGSITDSIQTAVTLLRETIFDIGRNHTESLMLLEEKGFIGGKEELLNALNDYWIAIIYNNSKNDSRELATALGNQGNNYLLDKGVPQFNTSMIIGDTDFNDIKKVIYDIQSTPDKKETPNLLLATSSISHGVDEDSFNQMFFFGMPNNTAEYIQAYSRVGRKYPGIVFDIIRLVRDRDKSYLKNFELFHKYKDKLIEAVPINRWAKNAIYSTLPGILNALLIQGYDNDCYYANNVKKRMLSGQITVERLKKQLIDIYGCELNVYGVDYTTIINEEVEKIYQGFLHRGDFNLKSGQIIAEASKKHREPMTSLRDIDIQLEVDLKQAGYYES